MSSYTRKQLIDISCLGYDTNISDEWRQTLGSLGIAPRRRGSRAGTRVLQRRWRRHYLSASTDEVVKQELRFLDLGSEMARTTSGRCCITGKLTTSPSSRIS